MSGRHRKPTTTGRTVAKVAVTGAIVGTAGVALAGTAHAAPDRDWDRLSQCESGGNWGINTGNGFQGGLQFSPSTWAGHGGTQFAPTANQATREQQIAIAENVLATQGWGAWPSCSQSLGLNSGATPRTAPQSNHQWNAPVQQQPQQTAVNSSEQLFTGIDKDFKAVQKKGMVIPGPVQQAFDAAKQSGIQVPDVVASFYEQNKHFIPGL